MLNIARLKGKIKAAMVHEQTEENNHNDSVDRIAEKLATAIIEEIKEAKINYSSGLTAPNGPVGGTLNHTIS
jgi:hypothetical protein